MPVTALRIPPPPPPPPEKKSRDRSPIFVKLGALKPGNQPVMAIPEDDAEEPSDTLFVRNISFEAVESDLWDVFEPHGDLKRVHLVPRRGLAFVSFVSPCLLFFSHSSGLWLGP